MSAQIHRLSNRDLTNTIRTATLRLSRLAVSKQSPWKLQNLTISFPVICLSAMILVFHFLHKMQPSSSNHPSGLLWKLPTPGEMGAPVFTFSPFLAQSFGCSQLVSSVVVFGCLFCLFWRSYTAILIIVNTASTQNGVGSWPHFMDTNVKCVKQIAAWAQKLL